MHQVDLGRPLAKEEIDKAIAEARAHPAVNALLQHLRNQSATLDFTGRQPPRDALPDFRAYHGGAADALEEVFWQIYEDHQP